MKRAFRILLDAISSISLLMAIAMTILWIRSGSREDELLYCMIDPPIRSISYCALRSNPGEMSFVGSQIHYADPKQFKSANPGDPSLRVRYSDPWGWSENSRPAKQYPRSGSFWNRRGFRFTWGRFMNSSPPAPRGKFVDCFISAPHWFLILLLLILPALRLRRTMRAWRRSKFNLCAACGYDLRASSGRCPECGRERLLGAV